LTHTFDCDLNKPRRDKISAYPWQNFYLIVMFLFTDHKPFLRKTYLK